MQIQPIERALAWSEFVVVRLLRRWSAAQASELNPLPEMVELAAELGEAREVAIVLHSLFQLTESCLGRSLVAECCCSRALSNDERAILALMDSAPAQVSPITSADVPHGLPGAMVWAAATARLALRAPREPTASPPARCRFER